MADIRLSPGTFRYVSGLIIVVFLLLPIVVSSQEDDVPSYLSGEAAKEFTNFLERPVNRAFAYSPDSGAWGYGYGYASMDDARQQALEQCEEYAEECRIIAENDQVLVTVAEWSRTEKIQWNPGTTYLILIMVALLGITLIFYLSYRRYMGSTEERNDIRTASLEVSADPHRALRRIEQYAENKNWIKIYNVKSKVIVLESMPGLINNGYFFRIELSSADRDRTTLKVGCRPRMANQLWHLFVSRQTNRLTTELTKVFLEED